MGIGVKFPLNDSAKLFIEYDVQSGFANVIGNNVFDGDFPEFIYRNGRSALNIGVLFDLLKKE